MKGSRTLQELYSHREDASLAKVERALGWTAESVRHPPKLIPDEVMKIWVREWAKVGVEPDREKLQEPKYPRAFLPRRWIVERIKFPSTSFGE